MFNRIQNAPREIHWKLKISKIVDLWMNLNIENITDCFRDERALKENKKYKYLQKIIFL